MNQENITFKRFERVAQRNRIKPETTGDKDLLQAHLNALFFSTAEKWMLPHWAIETMWEHGKRKEINNLLPNDKHRNWTVIGGPGSQSFAISDNTGLLTVLEECGSIDFWPKAEDIHFPSLNEHDGSHLDLVSIDDQMYEWKTATGPLEFNRLIYHVIEGGKEYIFNEIVLRNLSLESQEITFYVVLRPISIRGVEPVESISYDVNRRHLFSNGCLALIASDSPDMVIMDAFDNPNLKATILEAGNRIDESYSAARGNGTAVLKYSLHLNPAGHETVIFASPLFKVSESDAPISVNIIPRLRDDAVARWFDFNDDSPKGSYPDEEIMMATAQGKTSLVIQVRDYVRRMSPDILVGAASDVARLHIALSRSGCPDIANILALEIVRQLEGLEIDNERAIALSPLIWAFNEQKKIHPSSPPHDQVLEFINSIGLRLKQVLQDELDRKSSAKEIEQEPEKILSDQEHPYEDETLDLEGVATPLSIDDIINAEEELIDSIPEEEDQSEPEPVSPITLRSVLNSIWTLAASIDLKKTDEHLSDLVESYTEIVAEICKIALEEHSWSFDSDDDLDVIFHLIGAYSLLKGNYVYTPLIESITREVTENCCYRGLLRYPKPSVLVSSYLRLRLANTVMMLGDRNEVEIALEKLTDYLSEYHLLPQWVDVNTKGGAYGDGCSILAAADLRLLLRDILVYEKDGNLFVFPGLPEPWFTSTSSIVAGGIPTELGIVKLETGVSANQHQIEIELEHLPEEIEVFLPSHIPLHMVKVFGGSIVGRFETPIKRIRLVPLSERITLTFHR